MLQELLTGSMAGIVETGNGGKSVAPVPVQTYTLSACVIHAYHV